LKEWRRGLSERVPERMSKRLSKRLSGICSSWTRTSQPHARWGWARNRDVGRGDRYSQAEADDGKSWMGVDVLFRCVAFFSS
jgi:hypothetical protein